MDSMMFGALFTTVVVASRLGQLGQAQATRPDPPTLDSCKIWVLDYGRSNATTVYATFYVKCPNPVFGSIWVAGAILQGNAGTDVSYASAGRVGCPQMRCWTVDARR